MWALLRTVRVKTQPVCTSVRFRVRANSPLSVGPQCATVSPSKNPGSASTSSPALRILIEDRSSGEGLVVGLALDLIRGLRRPQVAVDRRRAHRQQLLPHRRAVPVTAEDQLAVAFQPVELHGHRGSQVLPALPTRGGPNLLQHLQRVVGILRRPRLARPLRDAADPHPAAASPPRSAGGGRCPATSRSPRPPGPESGPCPSSKPSHTPWRTWW